MGSTELAFINERFSHSESLECECGPANTWRSYNNYLYAFLEKNTEKPIGIAEASVRPACAPGWWID